MAAWYAATFGAGCGVIVLAGIALVRTTRIRRLWRESGHDTKRVAIVLELREQVHLLDATSPH